MNIGTFYDAIVIGGGASGLAAAVSAARAEAKTAIVERDVACGLKILATGNGRCNLSAARIDTARYRHPSFVHAVMGTQPERDLAAFFDSVGIVTTEEDGRLYPLSLKAESVRDALLRACERLGIDILSGCNVTGFHQDDTGTWRIAVTQPASDLKTKTRSDRKSNVRALRRALENAPKRTVELQAKALVIATGGNPADIAESLELPLVPATPVLCPVAAEVVDIPHALEDLDGLRTRASVTLKHEGAGTWSEEGEVLFRPYGISGVVAFNLSRRVAPADTVLLDFFPTVDRESFHAALKDRELVMGPFSPDDPTWFDGMLAPALARCACGIYRHCHPGTADVVHLVSVLKHFKLKAHRTAEEKSAQVMRGGIPVESVSVENLAYKGNEHGNLFICGEALDVDADCGGYNLAWAWLSGARCGNAAAHHAERVPA